MTQVSIRTGLERFGEVAVDVPEWTDMGRNSLSRQQRHRRPPSYTSTTQRNRSSRCCFWQRRYMLPQIVSFIADRLEIKLQPTKLRLFGLLASLGSLNVADDHCNECFFFENFETFLFDHNMPPLAQEHAKPNSCLLEDPSGRRQPWKSQHPF